MSQEINCEFTSEMVCPRCGHEHRDSLEFFQPREGEDIEGVECSKCGEIFDAHQHVEITYSTFKSKESK